MNGEKVLSRISELSKIEYLRSDKSVIEKLKSMDKIHGKNTEQIEKFSEFIRTVWDLGKTNENEA